MTDTSTGPDPGVSFGTFIDAIREDGKPIISPMKFADLLQIPLEDIASKAHVNPHTLREHPESPRAQRFLRDTLKVLSAATAIQADVMAVMHWMRHHPIPAFDHKVAWDLIGQGSAGKVVAYVDSIAGGFVG